MNIPESGENFDEKEHRFTARQAQDLAAAVGADLLSGFPEESDEGDLG